MEIHKLNSKNYQIANNYLKRIIRKASLNDEDLLILLNLDNKLIIADFFNLQPKFSKSNLVVIENYINSNLSHKNKLFVSDLIEFATDFILNINYEKCIGIIKKQDINNHFALMSSMEYVYSNLKINYISEISDGFSLVANNKGMDISARLKAAFYLFRITYKKEYLIRLKKIAGDDVYNKDILNNLLKTDFNKRKYFDGYNSILEILK